MSETTLGVNSWLEEELYQQYLHNRSTVDESWSDVFTTEGAPNQVVAPKNGESSRVSEPVAVAEPAPIAEPVPPPATPVSAEPVPPPAPIAPPPNPVASPLPQSLTTTQTAVTADPEKRLEVGPGEQLVPLRGAALKIAENMALSLKVPTATSQRNIPVKVIDENRRIINQHRSMLGQSKISYTHIIAYAIVKALEDFPNLNNAFADNGGESFRLVRNQINLGLAIDVAGRDGARSLVVPNMKNAGELDFKGFLASYDALVSKGRTGKLQLADFQGTTISLTNPGTVGTLGSVPRLMPGQGCIIATGAIDYPAEYQGMSEELRAMMGLGKVMMMGCTYDHRIIQGAESGMFLARMQALLQGENHFYDEIFASLKLPHQPVKWEADRAVSRSSAQSLRAVDVPKEAAVLQLINAFRVRGHLIGDLNPLGVEPSYHPELDPAKYGLTIWDLDREFVTGSLGGDIGEGASHMVATLRQILETLRQTYCSKLGVEFMHIQHPEEKAWLQKRMEPDANNWPLSKETKLRILERVVEAESFENFLHTRFTGHKRFSIEGGEAVMAILDELIDRAANGGAHEVVIGMAHRGRLNVLCNTIGKSFSQVFSEFEGNMDPDSTQGSGDVKYHLGASGVRRSTGGREVVVSVAPNPSHLEAADPVVEGIVRPKQDRLGDTERARVIPLLLHGDAAFIGQGVVAETFNLSQLDGYSTGGTLHVVINNQIGFTTNPTDSRSGTYCTDIARMVQAPVFHVNGDDPEACVRAAQLAIDYRQKFKKDVVIDMLCYRKYGHNEGDDPSYTQPLLYGMIKAHPSVTTIYAERLQREKTLTAEEVDRVKKSYLHRLSDSFDSGKLDGSKYEFQELASDLPFQKVSIATAVDRHMLEQVVCGITSFPDDFTVHPKLQGQILDKRKSVLDGSPMDWATAESLAFGTLVLEGSPVRLSGQDSGRGTFSQRHLTYYDNKTSEKYIPMQHLSPNQAQFDVWDSSLSEYAVLGFEFGYSVADPLTLTLWEAQFGDFANGAQIMIDQFIATCEQKWGQPSGLVMLLPHGQEGQGPEHSSGRIERFLTLCAENNMQVCNPTTPAQYFHLLRRQMHGGVDARGMRKPLIIFTPKSLLRHAKAVSTLDDLTNGGYREVIGDQSLSEAGRITRVILTSGKIYYELHAAREERNLHNVAIIRLEQYYPFPKVELKDVLMRYPITADVCWVQEEPRNMGAWSHVRDRLGPVLEESRRTLRYIGRMNCASPAPGSLKLHQEQQAEIIDLTFAAELKPMRRKILTRKRG